MNIFFMYVYVFPALLYMLSFLKCYNPISYCQVYTCEHNSSKLNRLLWYTFWHLRRVCILTQYKVVLAQVWFLNETFYYKFEYYELLRKKIDQAFLGLIVSVSYWQLSFELLYYVSHWECSAVIYRQYISNVKSIHLCCRLSTHVSDQNRKINVGRW